MSINTKVKMFLKKYVNIFEIYSLLGRKFKINRSKVPTHVNPILIDLGVGNNYKTGWIHVDFYSFHLKFWKNKRRVRKPEVEMDLRYPIKCPDDIVDGIYSSHTLEHLNYKDAKFLLSEIYRILKPCSWLRICVPDLQKYINFYIGKECDLPYEDGCEAISSLTQEWGHKSTWDKNYLKKILYQIGFINIKKVDYGKEGSDPRLIKEPETRKLESLVMEAQKPFK